MLVPCEDDRLLIRHLGKSKIENGRDQMVQRMECKLVTWKGLPKMLSAIEKRMENLKLRPWRRLIPYVSPWP